MAVLEPAKLAPIIITFKGTSKAYILSVGEIPFGS